jgi:SAM-dependent methyltransferase
LVRTQRKPALGSLPAVSGQRLRATVGRFVSGTRYQETAERVALAQLGLDHPDRVSYTASPWWALRLLLPRSAVSPSDVFVEFGCGKGRIVLEAALRYDFTRVVGVELAPELSEVARAIVAAEQHRLRCRDVTIETADATRYQVPDDMTHAYLYNPFTGTTFERVRANIVASLDRAPRRLRLIYLNPVEHETLTAGDRFRLKRRVRLPRVGHGAAIYEAA